MPTVREEFQTSIDSQAERWRHTEGQPENTLLRLSILRDIMRNLHAQKSRFLASGRKDLAQEIKSWEARIAELRQQSKLEGDLQVQVFGQTEIRKRTRLLPEALFTTIGRDKLERYDRQWELVLAAEAASQGWLFWALDAWVEITLVEEWNQRLTEQLWPSAIILFVESDPVQAPASAGTASSFEYPLWHGRWYLVMHPRFTNPAEITQTMKQWPGSPTDPPAPPAWKLLFSPKGR